MNISFKSTVAVFDLLIGLSASFWEDNSTFRSGHGSSEAPLKLRIVRNFSTLVSEGYLTSSLSPLNSDFKSCSSFSYATGVNFGC